MKRLLLLLSILFLLSISVSAQVTRMVPERTTENPPTVCGPGRLYANITVAKLWLGASDNSCVEVVTGGGAAGANTALSNLASVAINESLVFASGTNREIKIAGQVIEDTGGDGLALLAQEGNGTGNGGPIDITAGTGGATGNGGTLQLIGGTGGATSGNGGNIGVYAGYPPSEGNGGNAEVVAGDGAGTDKNGGSVNITSGAAVGAGTPGNINLTSTGNVAITAAAMTLNGSGVATLNPTTGALPYNDGTAFSDSPLTRVDANTVGQKNSTTTQQFRVYNTDDGAGNAEYLAFDYSSGQGANIAAIKSSSSGTGTARQLQLYGGTFIQLFTTDGAGTTPVRAAYIEGTNFNMDQAGIIWANDNTKDIGGSGANRPRNLFVGTTTTSTAYATTTNCSDSAGAAACGAAAAGSVVIDAGSTSVVISTTAITANSQVFAQFDSSLGTRLGVTCNTTSALPFITARTASTSFTVSVAVAPITNPACLSFFIVN